MKKAFLIVAVAAAVCACDPLDFFNRRGEKVDNQETLSHGMIILGDKLEDPYSVENITKALVSLYPTKADVDVSTTHLYVRFLPSGEEQFKLLEDMGVEMLDHPVDFQIKREGDYYHDPEIPENEVTWQYAVVPPDFDFPEGVRYEVLENCHITEFRPTVRAAEGIDWEAVERESFRLTGNADLLPPETRADEEESAIPEGRVTILDSYKGDEPIGVAGVRVSCNTFVKFAHAYTDENGYYKMNKSFSSAPRYRLVFKNKKGFAIGFNLVLCPASFSTLGRQSQKGCDVCIDKYSDRLLFARSVVNNAGWDYYNVCKGATGSISTPPANMRIWLLDGIMSSSAVMMQQGVGIDNTVIGDYLGQYAPLVKMFLPDITLGIKDSDEYAEIYSTAVHEFAHASHYMQVGAEYWNILEVFILKSFVTSGFVTYGTGTEENHGYCEVAEMWAYYLQTRLYHDRYPESDTAFGTNFWFYPQILNYMDERGIGIYKVFNALVPSVTDRDKLQEKLISLYPDAKTMILLAFNRYK